MTTTKTHRVFKFYLDATDEQRMLFAQHAGANRVAFNFAMELKNRQMQKRNEHIKSLIETGLEIDEARKAVKGIYKLPGAYDTKKAWIWLRDTRDWSVQPSEMKKAPDEFVTGLILDWIEAAHQRATERGEDVRGAFPWHVGINSYAVSTGLADADDAYKNYFDSVTGKRAGRKVGRPKFKKKGKSRDSFKLLMVSPKFIDTSRRIVLPTIGSVRIHDGALYRKMRRFVRKYEGRCTSITISRGASRWYASVLIETTHELPKEQHGKSSVGVDLGVALMAATSKPLKSGKQTFDRLSPARETHTKVASLQRRLARTQKGSNRRERLVRQLATVQHRIALQRANAQHQFTTELVRSSGQIFYEDLRVQSMTKKAAPKADPENEGQFLKNGKSAKSGLNRSILDVGWYEIRRQIEYKAERAGILAAPVSPINTSRECSVCGHITAENRKNQANFVCVKCGHSMNADINAAINIENRGRQALDAEMQDVDGGKVLVGNHEKPPSVDASSLS